MPSTHVPEVYDASLLQAYFRELRRKGAGNVKFKGF